MCRTLRKAVSSVTLVDFMVLFFLCCVVFDNLPYPLLPCVQGLVKPDIVFFGEALPDRFWLHEIDTSLADFLIVIGTSLEVLRC
jgi:hypothetical protein